jgi:DNA-binding protein H-NS
MPRQAALKLDAMTVSELLQLRDEIQTALSGKILMEREELQHKIDELSALETSVTGSGGEGPPSTQRKAASRLKRAAPGRGNVKAHPLKGRTVAPKYRDPDNPSQTWAGRGQAPRWLTAHESQGRKREDFLIGASALPRERRGH